MTCITLSNLIGIIQIIVTAIIGFFTILVYFRITKLANDNNNEQTDRSHRNNLFNKLNMDLDRIVDYTIKYPYFDDCMWRLNIRPDFNWKVYHLAGCKYRSFDHWLWILAWLWMPPKTFPIDICAKPIPLISFFASFFLCCMIIFCVNNFGLLLAGSGFCHSFASSERSGIGLCRGAPRQEYLRLAELI